MQAETQGAAISKVKATRERREGCASPALAAPWGVQGPNGSGESSWGQ